MNRIEEQSRVLHYFRAISDIPRCSGNRAPIAEYIMNFAKEQGLEAIRDEMDNVIVYKAASPDRADASSIALQGHTDMVCEKAADSAHDFSTDAIEWVTEGDTLRANQTTLGADNGIAVAMMLAILEDRSLSHPPIEAIFTSDEEIGLIGTEALEISKLRSKRLINIDSETEGFLWTGCAGGETIELQVPIQRASVTDLRKAVITVSGLLGGHSGMEIIRKRHNAVKVLTEVINRLKDAVPIGITEIAGGSKHNAIPRDAQAEIVFSEEQREELEKNFDAIIGELAEVYAGKGYEDAPEIALVTSNELADSALTLESFERVMACLTLTPTGVYSMSRQIEGMVKTSDNLAIVETKAEAVHVTVSLRSSDRTDWDALRGKVESVASITDAKAVRSGGYPAWEIKEESPLRDTFVGVYEEMFGKKMEVTAVHAGLECALFAHKDPTMDLVSLGPTMHEVHTPKEEVQISSVERVYQLIIRVLTKLD